MRDENLTENEVAVATSAIHAADGQSTESQNVAEYRQRLDDVNAKYGRMMLFIRSQDLQYFAELLRVCESNNDVVRAVSKINGGRVPASMREKDFVRALMPHLFYDTNVNGLYLALYKAEDSRCEIDMK